MRHKGSETASRFGWTIGVILMIFLAFFLALAPSVKGSVQDLCRRDIQNKISSVFESAQQIDSGAFLQTETKPNFKICENVKCVYARGSNVNPSEIRIDMTDGSKDWIDMAKFAQARSLNWEFTVNNQSMAASTGDPKDYQCDLKKLDTLKGGSEYTVILQADSPNGKIKIKFAAE